MKLAAIKDLHDHLMENAVNDFNANGEVTPSIFVAEISDAGELKQAAAVPADVSARFFTSFGSPDDINGFIAELLSKDGAIHCRMKRDSNISVNLVVQILQGSMESSPKRVDAILFLAQTTEGSFVVPHFILEEPKRHCVTSDFPPFESIRYAKGAFQKVTEDRRADVSKAHASRLH